MQTAELSAFLRRFFLLLSRERECFVERESGGGGDDDDRDAYGHRIPLREGLRLGWGRTCYFWHSSLASNGDGRNYWGLRYTDLRHAHLAPSRLRRSPLHARHVYSYQR